MFDHQPAEATSFPSWLWSTRARVMDSDQTVQRGIRTYGRSETFGSQVYRLNHSAARSLTFRLVSLPC